eukprot:5541101-Amphidinium_carterae.1
MGRKGRRARFAIQIDAQLSVVVGVAHMTAGILARLAALAPIVKMRHGPSHLNTVQTELITYFNVWLQNK